MPVRALLVSAAAGVLSAVAAAGSIVIDPFTDPMPTTTISFRGNILAVTQLWVGTSDPRQPTRFTDVDEALALGAVVEGGRSALMQYPEGPQPPSFDDATVESGVLTFTGRNPDNSGTVLLRYGDTPLVMQMASLDLDVTDAAANARVELDFLSYSSDPGSGPMIAEITLIGPAPGGAGLVSVAAGREVNAAGVFSIPFSEFSDVTGAGQSIDFASVQSVMVRLVGDGVGSLNYEMAPVRFDTGSQSSGTPASVAIDQSVVRILWFGNSHSGWNDFPSQTVCGAGVPSLLQFMADAAGLPVPEVVSAIACGQDLSSHWNNRRFRVFGELSNGEAWSHVVLQGLSTETTIPLGNISNFRMRAQQLYGLTRQASPSAVNLFYQTHARTFGSGEYPFSFVAPPEYHRQVQDTYRATNDLLNAGFGAGSSINVPAGDAFARTNWGPSMYRGDRNHMTPLGATVVALNFFGTLYNDPGLTLLQSFDPAGSSALATRLSDLSLSASDWQTALDRARASLLPGLCEADFNADSTPDSADVADMVIAVSAPQAFADIDAPFANNDFLDVLEWLERFDRPCN